jgi:hypothetical protein
MASTQIQKRMYFSIDALTRSANQDLDVLITEESSLAFRRIRADRSPTGSVCDAQ